MELMTMSVMDNHQQQIFTNEEYHASFNDDSFIQYQHTPAEMMKTQISNRSLNPAQESQHAALKKLVNKLGGTYCSGKPLSLSIRRQIISMAENGMKACDISRRLQISHGCVSKIIAKWRTTGSFEPRRIGGSKPKKTISDVVNAVKMYKKHCPSIRSIEIRRKLLDDGVCNDCNVPSLSSINRIIRMKLRDDLAEFEASAVRNLVELLRNSTTATTNACQMQNMSISSSECMNSMINQMQPAKIFNQEENAIYHFNTLPTNPWDICSISRNRTQRNPSTGSMTSTSSTESTFDAPPWSVETMNHMDFGQTDELINWNLDDELWSLLDAMK